MTDKNFRFWHFNREVSLSVLIQLVFLASLIVGSWINLQRQLDFLQKDVSMLLQCQKNFEQKLQSLSADNIAYEYRLQAVEKVVNNTPRSDKHTNFE
jgi:flagellar biosynthesis chaperone FliJ